MKMQRILPTEILLKRIGKRLKNSEKSKDTKIQTNL